MYLGTRKGSWFHTSQQFLPTWGHHKNWKVSLSGQNIYTYMLNDFNLSHRLKITHAKENTHDPYCLPWAVTEATLWQVHHSTNPTGTHPGLSHKAVFWTCPYCLHSFQEKTKASCYFPFSPSFITVKLSRFYVDFALLFTLIYLVHSVTVMSQGFQYSLTFNGIHMLCRVQVIQLDLTETNVENSLPRKYIFWYLGHFGSSSLRNLLNSQSIPRKMLLIRQWKNT